MDKPRAYNVFYVNIIVLYVVYWLINDVIIINGIPVLLYKIFMIG